MNTPERMHATTALRGLATGVAWALTFSFVQNASASEGVRMATEPIAETGVQEPQRAPAQGASSPATLSASDGLYVEFGRGVSLISEDRDFTVTLRGRIQTRYTHRYDEDSETTDSFFAVRRARLALLGDLPSRSLAFYLQIGLAAGDMETGHPIPLRDAMVSWTPHRDFHLRAGQMKVPFSRERLISSSALQLSDRSLVNAEFSLDRDVGVQVTSQDLFGLGGRLGYALGVFGGAGRNREGRGPGLLYVARMQVQPLGAFTDHLIEADLLRSTRPRLSLGAALGYHSDPRRVRSNQGSFWQDETRRHALHLATDLFAKWYGFSLQAEYIQRDMGPTRSFAPPEDDGVGPERRDGWGAFVQSGYVFPSFTELAGRYTVVRPRHGESSLADVREAALALGQYFQQHDLKLQADVARRWEGDGRVTWESRVQLQVFF